jgi:hemerythrin-like domain-containing protein
MNQAIRILRDEHRAIAAVLHGLQRLARIASEGKFVPDFRVFFAMIYYIDAFPERFHHPKEDAFLFDRLQARTRAADQIIGELRAEHVLGAQLIRDIEQALVRFEASGPAGAEQFASAVDRYAQFHWDHMRKEEEQLLPLAESHLKAEDWNEIASAFAANPDPIGDAAEKEDFDELYTRIVTIAPAPIGLGDPWRQNPERS